MLPDPSPMSQNQFERLSEIFEAVRELDVSQRTTFLDEACGDDASLRQEVEDLLAHHDDPEDGLGTVSEVAVPTDVREMFDRVRDGRTVPSPAARIADEDLPPGTRIGPYRLLERLGEGGMGIVYLAEQRKPVARRVAIKLIRLGMNSREVVARFEAESQALALMSHPGIAKVLDAGIAPDGRSYFVMEYVQGVPIHRYCDHHRLTVVDRLELFMLVCKAVHHAHQKGIMHRDLKPSNILVTVKDDRPVPVIIDFGIAKATHDRLSESTLHTHHGQLIGTPAYMSPEQADVGGHAVDIRTDIYSLGVILYELLVGAPPFAPDELRSVTYEEIRRRIREDEPLRPSTSLGRLDESDRDVRARSRGSSIAGILREVRGDLDWIIMKAIDKDPARRYESAHGLAADILRHLNDEPVSAGAPGTMYWVQKFVRRHRALVTSVLVVFAILSVAVVVSTVLAIGQFRARAESDRQTAIAQSVNEFVDRMLASPHPELSGRDVRVIDVLDDAAGSIDTRFAGQPLVEASIRLTLGTTYLALGEFDAAQTHLSRSHLLRVTELGADDPLTMDAMAQLGILSLKRGQNEEAVRILEDVLEFREGVFGPDDRKTWWALEQTGAAYLAQGRYDDAEARFRDLYERHLAVFGPDHFETATSMNALAGAYFEQGRWADAEPLLLGALETYEREHGRRYDGTLAVMNNLGTLYLQVGRLDDAQPHLEEALEGRRRILGEHHPMTLSTMNNVASLYDGLQRDEEAETLFDEILAVSPDILGPHHPQTLKAQTNLAALYQRTNRLDDAITLLRATLETRRDVLRDGHPDTLVNTNNLGSLYFKMERYADAEPLLRAASEGARRSFGPEHWATAAFLKGWGDSLYMLDRYEQAEEVLTESHAILVKAFGEDHPNTSRVARSFVRLYERWGKDTEAATWRAKLEDEQ